MISIVFVASSLVSLLVWCYSACAMDVRVLLTVVIVLAASRNVSTQNADDASNSTTSPSEPVTECLTAKNVSGVCVQRNSCDYSTGAIDLTLYAHHAYKRPCTIAEVCCPPAAILHVEPAKPDTSDSDEDEED